MPVRILVLKEKLVNQDQLVKFAVLTQNVKI